MHKNISNRFLNILKPKKGFTMTEVVVVTSIVGIMMAIALPSYISYLPRHRLQTSARQIYDDLNLAKIRAVKDSTVAGVDFNTVNETYTVFLDVDGVAGYLNGTDTAIKSNVTLENDVDITGTTLTSNTCGFNNRGMLPSGVVPALVPGQVDLTNPTNTIMRINVNTAGGISILTSTDGGVTWN